MCRDRSGGVKTGGMSVPPDHRSTGEAMSGEDRIRTRGPHAPHELLHPAHGRLWLERERMALPRDNEDAEVNLFIQVSARSKAIATFVL